MKNLCKYIPIVFFFLSVCACAASEKMSDSAREQNNEVKVAKKEAKKDDQKPIDSDSDKVAEKKTPQAAEDRKFKNEEIEEEESQLRRRKDVTKADELTKKKEDKVKKPKPTKDGRHDKEKIGSGETEALFTTDALGKSHALSGLATWTGDEMQGKRTAYGEKYDKYKFTAAHKTLPANTQIRVKNPNNLKTVKVRVNDRGPYKRGHVVSLSLAAAREIGITNTNQHRVTIEVIKWGAKGTKEKPK